MFRLTEGFVIVSGFVGFQESLNLYYLFFLQTQSRMFIYMYMFAVSVHVEMNVLNY